MAGTRGQNAGVNSDLTQAIRHKLIAKTGTYLGYLPGHSHLTMCWPACQSLRSPAGKRVLFDAQLHLGAALVVRSLPTLRHI